MPSEISVKEVRKKEGMKTKEHLFHNLMLYPLTKFFPVLFAFTFSENAFKGKQSMRKFSLQINVFFYKQIDEVKMKRNFLIVNNFSSK